MTPPQCGKYSCWSNFSILGIFYQFWANLDNFRLFLAIFSIFRQFLDIWILLFKVTSLGYLIKHIFHIVDEYLLASRHKALFFLFMLNDDGCHFVTTIMLRVMLPKYFSSNLHGQKDLITLAYQTQLTNCFFWSENFEYKILHFLKFFSD